MLKSVAVVLEFGGVVNRPSAERELAATVERQAATRPNQRVWRAVGALLAVVAISALVLVAPIDYQALGDYGYLGVFVVTLVTTGAFVLPIPYLAVIFKAGTLLNPLGVALVAGVAASLGELTGYLLGLGGRELIADNRWERAAERWMRRYGFVSIAVFAFIPNPVFDAAGVAAGALRYPAWRFALACFVGKTAKFLLIAWVGARW